MAPRGPLESFLRKAFDPGFELLMRFVVAHELLRDPVLVRLASSREEAMRRTTAEFNDRAAELSPAVIARDPRAIVRYDELLEQAIERMRSIAGQLAGGSEGAPLGASILGSIDRHLYKNEPEWLDDPTFPEDERSEAIDRLDRMNQALGTYDSFIAILMPMIEAAERQILAESAATTRRPVRVHDAASGHAGFAVLLKRSLGDRVEVEASDIKPEYLELGRARAETLGVRVDFYVEDALALDGPKARGVDILLCTQALHHFSPGMVARMMGEASRAARVGALFIDGERSLLTLARFIVGASIYGRHRTLIHDGITSIRRMFYKEELALFAALAPGMAAGASITTGSAKPAHGYLAIMLPPSTRGGGLS